MGQAALSSTVALPPLTRAEPAPALVADPFAPPCRSRARLWDLSPSFHCSIVGTCLTTGELRTLFVKLGAGDARSASDHDLHGRGVRLASAREAGGKLLHKLLDRRHEGEIRRFSRVGTVGELRTLWRAAFERGAVSGAYWAVLTHPDSSDALCAEAFGDVHMLSHLVGRSSRVDLGRLAELETALAARDEIIANQAERLAAAAADRAALVAAQSERDRVRAGATIAREVVDAERETLAQRAATLAEREDRLRRLEQRSETLGACAHEATATATSVAADLEAARTLIADLRAERDALEVVVAEGAQPGPDEATTHAWRARTILYVGGRPQTVARLAAVLGAAGGTLLTHDGGQSDHPSLLAGLVGRADAVLFPVDCVSHDAANHIKRACRDIGRRYHPLRSAGLAGALACLCAA